MTMMCKYYLPFCKGGHRRLGRQWEAAVGGMEGRGRTATAAHGGGVAGSSDAPPLPGGPQKQIGLQEISRKEKRVLPCIRLPRTRDINIMVNRDLSHVCMVLTIW